MMLACPGREGSQSDKQNADASSSEDDVGGGRTGGRGHHFRVGRSWFGQGELAGIGCYIGCFICIYG